MRGVLARKVAVEVLLKVELERAYANLALSAAFAKRVQLSERDRAFVTCLVQGVIRHRQELDGLIARFSSRPADRLAPPLKMVLCQAVYQLLYMKDIPQSAIVDTACEVARQTGHEGSARFVNGLLRSLLRAGADQEQKTLPPEAGAQELAGHYSMPAWLTSRWLERYGRQEALALLQFSQSVPPLVVRCCRTRITPEGLEALLIDKGMSVHRGQLVPDCLVIDDRGPVSGSIEKIPGYAEGFFAVQDEAAAFVSLLLEAKPGQMIVDLCAAPGGKSLHIAELMEGKGRVFAVDLHESRIAMLPAQRRRLGLANIESVCADGRFWRPPAPADAVLLDAPCTGTGVVNRRGDLRQNKEEPDLEALAGLQRQLLEAAAAMVKPGGSLVYSTCSIEPEEGYQQMDWFCANFAQFRPESLLPFLNEPVRYKWSSQPHWSRTQADCASGRLQLLPSRHGTSGFFVAKLRHNG